MCSASCLEQLDMLIKTTITDQLWDPSKKGGVCDRGDCARASHTEPLVYALCFLGQLSDGERVLSRICCRARRTGEMTANTSWAIITPQTWPLHKRRKRGDKNQGDKRILQRHQSGLAIHSGYCDGPGDTPRDAWNGLLFNKSGIPGRSFAHLIRRSQLCNCGSLKKRLKIHLQLFPGLSWGSIWKSGPKRSQLTHSSSPQQDKHPAELLRRGCRSRTESPKLRHSLKPARSQSNFTSAQPQWPPEVLSPCHDQTCLNVIAGWCIF